MSNIQKIRKKNYLCRMARIMAIDYGTKRVGLAVTDPLQIIANSLDTVAAHEALNFILQYTDKEEVSLFIIGYPRNLNNTPAEVAPHVEAFAKQLQKRFPNIPIEWEDERFTSKMAFRTMIDSGLKKSDRRNKATVDKISATIILQSYMERTKNGMKDFS